MALDVTFSDLGIPNELVYTLSKEGFTEPFEVQREAIPDAMLGNDICCRAPTGSGKTLAFALPLITNCRIADPHYPTALILTPTRELAEQITSVIKPLVKTTKLEVTAIYGGVSYNRQIDKIRKGVDIIVACPGRLLDLIDKGALDLDDVEFVVLDEADRMADMGFIGPVCEILDMCTSIQQTILFSATLDDEVAKLIEDYQHNPVKISVGPEEISLESMDHHFWLVQGMKRSSVAAEAISIGGKTIVFCRTRRAVDKLGDELTKAGLNIATLHGGLTQKQRDKAMSRFSAGSCEALIATDVAARGIDVEEVYCVINLDPPENAKAFKHRSGRTARAGSSGTIISMVQDRQRGIYNRIQKQVGLNVKFSKPNLNAIPKNGMGKLGERIMKKRKPTPRGSTDGRAKRKIQTNSDKNGDPNKRRRRNKHNDRSRKGRRAARHQKKPNKKRRRNN